MPPLLHESSIRRIVRDAPAIPPPTPPGISYELFIGFLWAGVAIATIFLAGRLYARFRGPRRLHLDDVCILFAYVLILITAALWQYAAVDMYYILNVNAGVAPLEADFEARTRRWLVISFVVEIFFYTILILFKLSMLFFFKRLGTNINWFNYMWWPILFFSLSTYFVSIGDVEYRCLFNDLETITVFCNSPAGTSFLRTTLNVNCALDVISDFLMSDHVVMLIPIVLLWNVQIKWAKKLAFMGIFSLSIITMAISIARAADIGATQKSNGLPDSIVVACSSAFRQLFMGPSQSKAKPAWSPTASYYERLKSNFRSRAKRQNNIALYGVSTVTETGDNLDCTTIRESSDVGSHHDSEDFVLVPGGPRAIVACHTAPGPVRVRENQITQEHGYHITHHRIDGKYDRI
ncbi:hypothetical protein F5Y04DRAFT_287721 [Hypomontagnella monticulosa]|nr:hypothetical protein F5Y04DRAFT_287721 [Hypomontagnella monticulosa]